TSPPYFALRQYEIEPAVWGGNIRCDHVWAEEIAGSNRGGSGTPTSKNNRGEGYGRNASRGTYCKYCGAWKGQLGLEPFVEDYVDNIARVFMRLHHVLRPDGTVWLNIGDSYASGGMGGHAKSAKFHGHEGRRGLPIKKTLPVGFKNKDLLMVPHRVAMALQKYGWYVRNDIIWYKRNALPSSVTDRCPIAHEYVFLLTKEQKYYFDYKAIEVPATADYAKKGRKRNTDRVAGPGFDIRTGLHRQEGRKTRRRRSVWDIPTRGLKGEHYAVMPEALAEICVLAGSRPDDVVLDPFSGAGTTGVACLKHHRQFVGVEAGESYIKIAHERLAKCRIHYPSIEQAATLIETRDFADYDVFADFVAFDLAVDDFNEKQTLLLWNAAIDRLEG
ncbi:MAG: site-specific DNA-methyltransferase, partial [bacterium]